MIHRLDGLRYQVVGIRGDGSRDVRYRNLSWQTAEQVKVAMIVSLSYDQVVIEDQLVRKLPAFKAILQPSRH